MYGPIQLLHPGANIIMRLSILAVGLGSVFCASHASAHTIVVGTCEPSANSLPTIGAAVTAVGTNGVVKICPGTYPEQVVINRSMTLEGVSNSNSAYPSIVVPVAGLVTNTTDFDTGQPTAAQILVTSGATVNISGLTVDGSNNNITTCGEGLSGVMFQNASGSVKSSAVVNQVLPAGYAGCQNGLAIYAETSSGSTSSVTIEDNIVQNFDKNGITADDTGTSAVISGNIVTGQGSWSGAGQNSIQVAEGATASITGNTVGSDIWGPDQFGDTADGAAGILIYDSPGVSITKNTVSSTQYGIAVVYDGMGPVSDGAVITGNMIATTYFYDAVDVCGANNAAVIKNVVSGAGESAIHIDSTCAVPSTGSTITGNKINFACAGILIGTGSSATLGTNSILNAGTQVLSGADVCAGESPVGPQVKRKAKPPTSPFGVRH